MMGVVSGFWGGIRRVWTQGEGDGAPRERRLFVFLKWNGMNGKQQERITIAGCWYSHGACLVTAAYEGWRFRQKCVHITEEETWLVNGTMIWMVWLCLYALWMLSSDLFAGEAEWNSEGFDTMIQLMLDVREVSTVIKLRDDLVRPFHTTE